MAITSKVYGVFSRYQLLKLSVSNGSLSVWLNLNEYNPQIGKYYRYAWV